MGAAVGAETWVRTFGRVVLGGAVAGTIVLAGLAPPAHAEISGPCTATVGGIDVGPLSATKPSDAVKVDYRERIAVASTAGRPMGAYKVELALGGVRWTVGRGQTNDTSWQRNVNVNKYAKYGVGIYQVIGSSAGCSGTALVKVTGKSPLSTTAGIAGVVLTALGALGVVATAFRARRLPPAGGVLALASLPAFLLVGTGVAAAPHVSFRRRFSIVGMLSGIVGGIGVLVLLQQYAIAFPTRRVLVVAPVLGVLVSLLLTNLAASGAARRSRRRAGVPAAQPPVAAPVAPEPAPAAAVFAPTHTVPDGGLVAYARPDGSQQPVDVDGGLEVMVTETNGRWARVEFSNGWVGWVDGTRLEEIDG
ncbi:MAG: hypothetical protein JWO37_1494 [Acidimicrobiales bacterium]|jgi:hypothetical protein|nr:hypothetical protein [Acidimicrobiales bacterium]